MKIAHLADLHLGFRQHGRQNAEGTNQREADVTAAFERTVDAVVAAAPDVVLFAGDVFHSVRPANPVILDAFHQLRRLREGLPSSPIVIVSGNHDTPRSVETGTILKLFEAIPDIHVAVRQARTLVFDALDLAVHAVPHAALVAGGPPGRPTGGLGQNILLQHCEVAGVIPGDRSIMEFGGFIVEPGDLCADTWDYVALGHYHVAQELAANMWYAGAIEYTSNNAWAELNEGVGPVPPGEKGWLLVTLGSGDPEVRFQPVEPARRHIELDPIYATDMTAADIDEQIVERIMQVHGGIDDQVVRQIIYDVPRNVSRGLDHAFMRELKSRALHFLFDVRRPEPVRIVGAGAPGRRQTLAEILEEFLRTRELSPGVDRKAFVDLGTRYLDNAARQPRDA